MRTTTSAAAALKANAPANTRPINRFKTIIFFLLALLASVRNARVWPPIKRAAPSRAPSIATKIALEGCKIMLAGPRRECGESLVAAES
jgi:hypothetical protein